MPRVKKRRGKLSEVKEQRREAKADEASHNAKRRKLDHTKNDEADADDHPAADEELYFEDTTAGVGVVDEPQPPQDDDMVFYGLLDEEEQAYYANVNAKITSDDFEDSDEKAAFIDAVYRESRGKEMKLACSQACSRHLERLLMLSAPDQLRDFFSAILEGLLQLVQHRFGSHVCETLFLQSAKYVSRDNKPDEQDTANPTLASLFLQAADQLRPNMGFMLTDKFASHTIRALLLVLSGEPLDDTTNKTLLASKRKEQLGERPAQDTATTPSRKVPKKFLEARSTLTTAAIASLDTTYLRALATHPTGNPVLQLLLRLELTHSDKGRALDEKSLFHRLVYPDESLNTDESESAKWISGLTYDPTGSRLIEVLVVDSPGKVFKKLYQRFWKDRMASMAKNDIASFVAIKILVRLGKDELLAVRELIIPDLHLLTRRRKFSVIQTLVERSVVRELDMKAFAKAFQSIWAESAAEFLRSLLFPNSDSGEGVSAEDVAADLHGSLLAQALLKVDELGASVRSALSAMDTEELLKLANDTSASRVLQMSLTNNTAPVGYKKQMIPRFYGHMSELAISPIGSYVADALWDATNSLHFMKQRLAEELAENETDLRDSYSGRKVWRNWSMDLYTRRRGEWQARAKGMVDTKDGPDTRKKTPIELARQRRAEEKAKAERQEFNPVVSANA